MKPGLLQHFHKIFDVYLPQTICEIGTHNGQSAFQFVDYLWTRVPKLHYTGYDLFEGADADITKAEHNGKGPGRYGDAFRGLDKRRKKYGGKFNFELIKGNTNETLTTPRKFDFVYIDGGHSYETVMHDYAMLKESTVIVFDDYQIKGVKEAVDEIMSSIDDCKFLEMTNPERPKRKQMLMMRWDDGRHDQIAFLKS